MKKIKNSNNNLLIYLPFGIDWINITFFTIFNEYKKVNFNHEKKVIVLLNDDIALISNFISLLNRRFSNYGKILFFFIKLT